MTTEQQLREKLRKITALFEGAATAGERQAAAAAMERIRRSLGSEPKSGNAASSPPPPPLPETKVSFADVWQRRLFVALCRRYGLEPYRYKGQRKTTLMVRAPQSLFARTIWPEYLQLQAALNAWLNEATERIIREEVFGDTGEASER